MVKFAVWTVEADDSIGKEVEREKSVSFRIAHKDSDKAPIVPFESALLVGMKEGQRRFVVVPSQKESPTAAAAAFIVELVRILHDSAADEETSKPAPQAEQENNKSARLGMLMSKVGQPVIPLIRESDKNKAEDEKIALMTNQDVDPVQQEPNGVQSELPKQQRRQKESPLADNSEKHLMDLVLAETRLQNTEMRMSMAKLDDKIDRLTTKITRGQASPQQLHQPSTTSHIEALEEENGRLKSEAALAKDGLEAAEADAAELKQENSDLRNEMAELKSREDGIRECGDDAAAAAAAAAKKLKKVLAKVYKQAQYEFESDVSYSGEQVKQTLGEVIRGLFDQIAEAAAAGEEAHEEASETSVEPPSAKVVPVRTDEEEACDAATKS